MVEAVFANLGIADIGQCCPTSFTTGNLVPGETDRVVRGCVEQRPLEIKGHAEVHGALALPDDPHRGEEARAARVRRCARARGLTTADVPAYLAAHPEIRRATYRVPPADVAGTAARLVLDVARRQARA